ncbi:MAG TPA: DUF4142 domain-containing protein [Terriglobales bacterium]|nr:DUF4142 domain-containing protein [Terriglobales bacterium]
MRLFRNSLLLAAAGLFALAIPLAAQQAATQPSRSSMSANQRAADYLNTVNQTEIDTAKMMQDHSQNDQVKDFAKMLQDDHQNAQNQLQTAASQSKIDLNTNAALKKASDTLDNRLKNDSASQADRSYLAAEVRDHKTAINRLKMMEGQVTDAQIKGAIDAALPLMQKHLDAAQKLQSQLGLSGK